ncbi:YopT-type cysteine protease domain-containing protein [Erwinia papayae]|uniref:YopT-type cysteine protease domain-containing protein n=1 Tax=Erwinia papayae TaxID=206499 RepID=A0ABV3N6V6_9GAMM
MNGIDQHARGLTPSKSVHVVTSHTPGALMPDPADIRNSQWKKLPDILNSVTLARFDQDKCTSRYGINSRAMCFGLSLSWNSMIHGGKKHPTPYSATERMRELSSFEGVVNARTLHNYYQSEHKFLLQNIPEEEDMASRLMAGTNSLLQTAELKGLHLTPTLEDKTNEGLPFLIVCKSEGRYRSVDQEALKRVSTSLEKSRQGVLTIYSDEQAHALGFCVSEHEKSTILFDPNLGEFCCDSKSLPKAIEALADTNHLPLIGVQVFASRPR